MIKGLQLLKSKGAFWGVLGHTPDGVTGASALSQTQLWNRWVFKNTFYVPHW